MKLVAGAAELAHAGRGVGEEAGVGGAGVHEAVHDERHVFGGHAAEARPRGGGEGADARVGALRQAAVAAGLAPQPLQVVESRDGV